MDQRENSTFSKDLNLVHSFRDPGMDYRPMVRWWWPGGDVEKEELLREIGLLADNMFRGAEIQPFVSGIDPKEIADPASPIHDYDSKAYYEKLVAVLEEAKKRGLTIDLTMGSGWHAGGTMVPLEDNIDTLIYGEMTVEGELDMPVPAPDKPYAYELFSVEKRFDGSSNAFTRVLHFHPEKARLLAVVAAKIVENGRFSDPSVLHDTVVLDPKTAMDISGYVKDGRIQWAPPSGGQWQVIAIYSMPSGSQVMLTADIEENYMVNPFDTEAILRYYENWIGKHPELLQYAGSPLRALFNDSYEYFVQRFFSDDFIELFRKNRGYDIIPWLPAVFEPGRDQAFFFFIKMQQEIAPEFSFGEISRRINYDYDRTVSDLFFKHWYPVSRKWIEERGLLFRQQGYNPPLDVIKAAGAASIPETENLMVPTLKQVTSGGHLYGRPIISAESFVFYPGGTFSITPQKYKQGIDVLMTSGVNEIIYHGMPYRWNRPGYGEFGWSPFTSPYGGDIATNISEGDSAFWQYQKDINTYAARLQFLMKQGKPDADILVYFPLFANPEDEAFTPVLETLDANGRVWEWVNDELIQEAKWEEEGLVVGDMVFQGIVLPNIEALPVETAESLAALAREGVPIAVYGKRPAQQPGFFNYEENDQKVAREVASILEQDQCRHISDPEELGCFVRGLPAGRISYETNPSLTFIRRSLGEEGHLAFIRNVSPEPVSFVLTVDPSLKACYWFEAVSGRIYKANVVDGRVEGSLHGFGSIALVCGKESMVTDAEITEGNPVSFPKVSDEIPLTQWSLEIRGEDVPGGRYEKVQDALGDWRGDKDLQYVSSPGIYTCRFSLDEILPDRRYLLDLGAIHAAADVTANGQAVGHMIFSPYQLDITEFVKVGENSLRIKVTPPLRNRLVGKALSGDPEYRQFAGGLFGAPKPIPSGLEGPAAIKIISQ
ncbi:MAG: glycosyl hydrolase [Clostridia bacterium]